ncbi:Inositol-1-monophosphatase [Pirellulimonas nuda]|uniref:Inositol-1-monophosphatase n=1 Tax=Pirellulimonas nuda TaxID=2528009 RepID=A0A518DJ89_9BACT|nr:inositol monophosphatase family protein [Pirellulimonas nuda]QDU91554.1 Inositol-1-monophosphatase [Pirellulimonas nuda]
MPHPIPAHLLSLDPDLTLAAQAAEAAGAVIRDGYGRMHSVERKGVGDLVSDIDRRADRAALEVLRSGSCAEILSEELNPNLPAGQSPAAISDLWIVDPLDATSAFLMHVGPQYPSVLIARRRGGRTHAGVAYFPLTGEWFYAVEMLGAFKNGAPLTAPSEQPLLADSWVEMNPYGEAALETEFFTHCRAALRSPAGAGLVTAGVPNAGIGLRCLEGLSHLALVVHDNRPQSVKQGPWDIAAVQLIVEEAGGVMLSPRLERTCPFRAEPILIAPHRGLIEEVINLVGQPQTLTA